MSKNVQNVTASKPSKNGVVRIAPLGTTLPTDATSELDSKFVDMGYVSTDGIVNKLTNSSTGVKAFGGDNVLNLESGITQTVDIGLMESLNTNVLKFVHGAKNVDGTDIKTGIHVKINNEEKEEYAMVIDLALRGGVLKRITAANAKLTELGDIVYKDDEPVIYKATVGFSPDTNGNASDEYLIQPQASQQSE